MTRALAPSLLALLALAACNAPPTTMSVMLEPATSSDDLEVKFLSQARDVNGDVIEYQYVWSVNGAVRADQTGPIVNSEVTSKGETWSVEVIPTDGSRKGDPAIAEVLVRNSPPTATASAVATAVKSTEDLQATASGTDVDGDTVEIQWYWTVDGEGTPFNGPTVPAAAIRPGETWVAHAVGFDGEDRGAPAEVEIEVLNAEPVITSLVLSPEEPYTHTPITATVDAYDPDDQAVRLTYRWLVDGREVARGVDLVELPAERFAKHQDVAVEVTPNDSVVDGEMVSESVTVLNSLPTEPVAAISPEEPIPDIDDMRCVVVEPSTDMDGDEISYRVRWTVDGYDFTAATTTEHPGDTVPRNLFNDDEEWTCTLIPSDDDGDGISTDVVVVPETWSGPRTFTSCGGKGKKGPTQKDCDGGDGYLGTDLEGEVTLTEGIQEWVVPVDGRYRITALGGAGSASSAAPYKYSGGQGAILRGDFDLKRGDKLLIAVGHNGTTDGYSAGGGGGTWVMKPGNVPLLVAGGGGATGYYGSYYGRRNGCNAMTSQYAGRGSTTSYSSVPSYACASKGTSARYGGTTPGSYSGNGGGGMDTKGANDPYTYYGGSGGESWKNGAAGGNGAAAGGFGGGGGGNGSYASGGGGGWSGGDAGRTISGGGGSYNTGTNQSNSVGNTGDGEVMIDWLGF